MAVLDIDWKPDTKKLKLFSIAWLAMCLILGAIVGHQHYDKFAAEQPWTACWIIWTLGAIVFFIGLVNPSGVRPFYVGLTALTFPIGFVISHLVLGFVYFIVITPLALIFRIMRRDELHCSIDPEATTYWHKRPPAPPAKRYFQQF